MGAVRTRACVCVCGGVSGSFRRRCVLLYYPLSGHKYKTYVAWTLTRALRSICETQTPAGLAGAL